MDEWLRSKETGTYDELKELVLVEEFKSCVSREIKLHLEELKLGSLHENAIASDEYALSHKLYIGPSRWKRQNESVSLIKVVDSKKDVNEGSLPRDNSPKKGNGRWSPRWSPRGLPT